MKLILKILLIPTLLVYTLFLVITQVFVILLKSLVYKIILIMVIFAFIGAGMAGNVSHDTFFTYLAYGALFTIYGFFASFIIEAMWGVHRYMMDFLTS